LEQSVDVKFTGQETWPTEIVSVAYGTGSGYQGALAYVREAYQYRLAGLLENTTPAQFGRLYLSGIIEFFQPSFGAISGVGVVEAPTALSMSSTSESELKSVSLGSFSSGPTISSRNMGSWASSEKLVIGSKDPDLIKVENPDDPVIIPPIPKLIRSSGVDRVGRLATGSRSMN
jgi:hypothetical protein